MKLEKGRRKMILDPIKDKDKIADHLCVQFSEMSDDALANVAKFFGISMNSNKDIEEIRQSLKNTHASKKRKMSK